MLRRFVRSWGTRVAVEGRSMLPTLEPGDWLLVDPDAYRQELPATGELVVVPDPRLPERLLVKRVTGQDGAGDLIVAGDSARRSTDSRVFGALDPASIDGRPWVRYWHLSRLGRVR